MRGMRRPPSGVIERRQLSRGRIPPMTCALYARQTSSPLIARDNLIQHPACSVPNACSKRKRNECIVKLAWIYEYDNANSLL